MATLDVGSGHGGRRALDHDIPLIPFIDFLLCLVAFLLVTAVWSQMARLQADAQVPGKQEPGGTPEVMRELHVNAQGDNRFHLLWKENGTVINSVDVERKRVNMGDSGDYSYPELAAKVAAEWQTNGQHRAVADQKLDRAVLHVDNNASFADIAAIMDALHATKRQMGMGPSTTTIPAFNVAFAVN